MAIKPMLFNTEMVQALLEGRKTVTRRVVKPQPKAALYPMPDSMCWPGCFANCEEERIYRPPFQTGDILWVRETFRVDYLSNIIGSGRVRYKSDGAYQDFSFSPERYEIMRRAQRKPGWRPNENMPREVARIFLRVIDVSVERLQNITEDDVCAEGAEPLVQCPYEHPTYGPDGTLEDMCWNTDCCGGCEYIGKSYGELFGELIWDSTIKPADQPTYGWEVNPWVWVIEFERCEKPEGWPC